MKTIRRSCAVALSGVIVAAMLAAMPASADTPEAFTGNASAWALNAEILNLVKLKAGATNVTGDSTPNAHADGAGLTSNLIPAAGATTADALGAGKSASPGKQCVGDIPLQGILHLSLICSTSNASTMSGPVAGSVSTVLDLNVELLQLVFQLLKPITDVLAPLVDKTIGSVTGTLQPVLGGLLTSLNLGSLGLDLNKPVQSLLDTLKNLATLATVEVLPSVSTLTNTASGVTAAAQARGAAITVLPGLTVAGHPLIKITVLAASATATYDRSTGKSAATVDPAIVTVQLLDAAPLKVGLQPITLLAGTPLESTISLGAGTSGPTADGGARAVADGLSIHLLKGISGGINLDLAHAEAAVNGAKATASPVTTTTSTTAAPVPQTHTGRLLLATTGTSLPLLPIGFILILAGYLTRRRLVRR